MLVPAATLFFKEVLRGVLVLDANEIIGGVLLICATELISSCCVYICSRSLTASTICKILC